VDHGCETPEERKLAGKLKSALFSRSPAQRGMLFVTVADDGAGIHPERLRENVVLKTADFPGHGRKK